MNSLCVYRMFDIRYLFEASATFKRIYEVIYTEIIAWLDKGSGIVMFYR